MVKTSQIPEKLWVLWTDRSVIYDPVGGTTNTQKVSNYLDRANHTWTQAAVTISDFDTEVSNNTTVVWKQDESEKWSNNWYASLDWGWKIPLSEIPESIVWWKTNLWLRDANANTPTITSWVGNAGDFYTVQTAWSTNIDGISTWNVNDTIIFDWTLSVWEKIESTKNNLYWLEYFSLYDASISSTTSTTFQPKLSITETLLWWIYEVSVSYWWNHSSTNTDFESEIVVDGWTIPWYPAALNSIWNWSLIHKEEPKESWGNIWWTNSWQVMPSWFHFEVTLWAWAHTIDLNYRSDDGWDSSWIRWSSISIKRIW
jgi:hypothetical protein